MKSYGRASEGALSTLLDLRAEGERQAEGALAASMAARGSAEADEARLADRLAAARAAVAAARRERGPDGPGGAGDAGGPERAADAQARRRFWARLEAQADAAAETLARHRTQVLAPAIDADAAARAAHVRARQRREVVEKAIARRQAARRREAERRDEAIQDDRYAPAPRARTNTPTTGK